jgi:hypothetical protein
MYWAKEVGSIYNVRTFGEKKQHIEIKWLLKTYNSSVNLWLIHEE